jgi:hypothetical protein
MITITLSGFKTKEQAIEWLNQYEGSLEQHFDFEDEETPSMCVMEQYIPEMKSFKDDETKLNFNLELK